MWFFKSVLCANPFSHIVHLNSLLSLCVRWCIRSVLFRRNRLPWIRRSHQKLIAIASCITLTTRCAHEFPGCAFVPYMFLEIRVIVRLPLAMIAYMLLHREMFACYVSIQIMWLFIFVRAANERAIECRLMKVHVEHGVLYVHVRFSADATAVTQVCGVFVQFFRILSIR